eukprot:scaffold3497_cov153-Isochrysis_galbana.AAC.5
MGVRGGVRLCAAWAWAWACKLHTLPVHCAARYALYARLSLLHSSQRMHKRALRAVLCLCKGMHT